MKQANKIAHNELVKHIASYGYKPFVLCVDDFGIKYVNKENLDDLLQALKDIYNIKEDLTGRLYHDIHSKWDYNKRIVTFHVKLCKIFSS